MIVVSLETWVSVGTLLIAMLALATFLRSALVGLEARLGKRIDMVDTKIDTVETSLGKRIDTVETNLGKRIDTVEISLTKRIDTVETNLDKRINTVEISLTKRIDTVETNLGKRIDLVATSVEKLDDRVYALAAGIKPLLESAEDKTTRATRRPASPGAPVRGW